MDFKIIWTLQPRQLEDLYELEKNPRLMSKEQRYKLLACIEQFGLIDKPIVNLDGQIIGGHQRIRILLDEGISTIECWVPDRLLDQREVEILCLSLNRQSGDWDWDKLANYFDIETLLKSGFEAKDFHDQKPDKKIRVTIDFDTREDLDQGLELIEQIQNCKVKVKI